jgi:hypothetical protein
MRGPGRAVTGGVHWGVRSVCAGGVRARPRRGLHCRVSVGRGGSGWAPWRRKRGGWAYACRARVVGIGVRTAAARAECGMRAAWARVEGATLQGFEDRGTTLALSRSLSLSLALALSLARSLACSLSLARSLARLFSLSLSPRGELHRQGHHLIDPKLRPGGKSEPKTTSTHES